MCCLLNVNCRFWKFFEVTETELSWFCAKSEKCKEIFELFLSNWFQEWIQVEWKLEKEWNQKMKIFSVIDYSIRGRIKSKGRIYICALNIYRIGFGELIELWREINWFCQSLNWIKTFLLEERMLFRDLSQTEQVLSNQI